jgi:CheY-like chemotaxis protein
MFTGGKVVAALRWLDRITATGHTLTSNADPWTPVPVCPAEALGKRGDNRVPEGDATMAEILVVEDNSAVRMAYRLLLKTAGHSVTEAASGDDAIAKLARTSFDLIITDLWMPGIDGFQVIAEAKRQRPGTPVLAVTGGVLGTAPQDPARRATSAGADAVIEKPMLGEGMLSAVNALIGGGARRPAAIAAG